MKKDKLHFPILVVIFDEKYNIMYHNFVRDISVALDMLSFYCDHIRERFGKSGNNIDNINNVLGSFVREFANNFNYEEKC